MRRCFGTVSNLRRNWGWVARGRLDSRPWHYNFISSCIPHYIVTYIAYHIWLYVYWDIYEYCCKFCIIMSAFVYNPMNIIKHKICDCEILPCVACVSVKIVLVATTNTIFTTPSHKNVYQLPILVLSTLQLYKQYY